MSASLSAWKHLPDQVFQKLWPKSTDGAIYVTPKGASNGPEWNLFDPVLPIAGGLKFERNAVDVFVFTTESLGGLTSLHVRHDDAHHQSGRFMSEIEVLDKGTNRTYVFKHNGWLAMDQSPFQIATDLYPEVAHAQT